MEMQIGKWGNSLAVRLPRDLTERYKLKEGDMLKTDGIERDLEAEEAAERKRVREEALRQMADAKWVLPPEWKFDREEANWRPAMDRWKRGSEHRDLCANHR